MKLGDIVIVKYGLPSITARQTPVRRFAMNHTSFYLYKGTIGRIISVNSDAIHVLVEHRNKTTWWFHKNDVDLAYPENK